MSAFAAGTFAGWLSVLASHPLDTVKVRAQTSHAHSALYIFQSLVRNEGLLALWKGVLPPLLSAGLTNAVFFGVYAEMKSQLGDRNPTLFHHWLGGVAAGVANSFILGPSDHVKIRLQVQRNSERVYTNTLDCFTKILKTHGISGLYKGFGCTLFREMLGGGLFVFTYNAVAQWGFGREAKDLNPHELIICGAASSLAFVSFLFPVDAVKSRLQADSLVSPRYSSALHCFQGLWKEKRVYRGIAPSLLRSLPYGSSTVLGYELSLPFFEKLMGS